MYKYDHEKNELIEIPETTFTESKILERENIEEWIRKNPETLGEELLIIGHEYDKFETNDRLDLLAIDKDGKLVIVEIKRDKTGSNVEFQCLKYCSYCSQLEPSDVIEVYNEYLKKNKINDEPVESIIDFLELPSDNEDTINEILNNGQRFIIIGKEIDRRILSVCAWLYENGIDVKCLSIKPFINNNELYIDIDQIIPPFKINDYYVQKKESRSEKKKILQPANIIEFFNSVVEYVRANTSLKINYSPRKPYCIIRTGGKIEITLRYFKRNNSFSIHAVVKKIEKKDRLKDFFNQNKEELQNTLGYEVVFQEEGERNPNWSYLRVIVDNEASKTLTELVEKFGNILILFAEYVIDNW